MTLADHKATDRPRPTWGVFLVAFCISLYLVGLPSSQAFDAPLLSAALEDWDEIDPVEDKNLLPQSDHQPDVEGVCFSMPRRSDPRHLLYVESMTKTPSLVPSDSDARAPPVR
jgi:hypothetical protein